MTFEEYLEQFNEKDKKNIRELEAFLTENNIEYSLELNNFCLHYNNPDGKRTYQICYINAEQHAVQTPKYNVKGVAADYFYLLSKQAIEEENSFRCWVKDYEWEDDRKREVLKSYIMYAAGKIKSTFYARDCEVREVETKEAREFESINCFYGKRGASLNLGLYLKKDKNGIPAGTLIFLYTFGLNFFGKDGSIEVLRVGTRKFCNCIGGASKILTYFKTNYKSIKLGNKHVPVTLLKFYSDLDHNIGGSMAQLGFEFVSYSKGGFMNLWTETNKVKGREPGRHKWVMEQMALGKVVPVSNAGVKTYIMRIERTPEELAEIEQLNESLKPKVKESAEPLEEW